MDLTLMWHRIKKDIVNKDNEDKVHELLRQVQGDVVYVDKNGKRVLNDVQKRVKKELKALGEDKMARYV